MAPPTKSKKQKRGAAPPPPPTFVPNEPLPTFLDPVHEGYYVKLKNQSVTESKCLVQSKLKYPITDLFRTSTLLPLLGLTFAYNKEFLYVLLANMRVAHDFSRINSRIEGQDVLITRKDLHVFLDVSMSGPSPFVESAPEDFDWLLVNNVIRDGVRCAVHLPDSKTLNDRAYLVQSVLRHSVFPKAGDRGSISPYLSLATYYILTDTPFNVADTMIRYIDRMISVRRESARVSRNVALGSALAFVLKGKYGIVSSEPIDAFPTPFTNGNFSSLRSSLSSGASISASAPVPPPAPSSDIFGDEDLEGFLNEPVDPTPAAAPPPSEAFDFAALGATLGRLEANQGVFLSRLDEYQISNSGRFDSLQESFDELQERQDVMREHVDWMYSHWWTPPPPPPTDG